MNSSKFLGKYCNGRGATDKLKHINDCASVFYPTPTLPNLSMIYNSATDTFKEGFIWGNGFWLQNSYGFISGAVPFLNPFWFKVLQNSLDLFWDRMGDGKRYGAEGGKPCGNTIFDLCAPSGALGDCVLDGGIVYKQGDNDFSESDWFYETTAAAISMQSDILCRNHDKEKSEKYYKKMMKSVQFIEGARAENGLFSVGPSCNLLAPSYGAAIDAETGEIKKCYLTGLSVTYSIALSRLIEVAKFLGKKDDEKTLSEYLEKTVNGLSLLKTDEGYFIRFMEEDKTMHGVFGAKKYGYFDAVCNIDAVAFGVVDDNTSEKIYQKIASIKGLRQFDFLCNNYPSLDDTPWAYKKSEKLPYHYAGEWVDGGAWNTVEGRATLAYFRMGKHDDAFKSSFRNMQWLEDYRMDEPYTQWGGNFYNYWQGEKEEGGGDVKETAIMIDDFASPACLLRGLLGVKYYANGVEFFPSLHSDIDVLKLNIPVWIGEKRIFVTLRKNAKKIFLNYNDLPLICRVDIGEKYKIKTLKKTGKTDMRCDDKNLPSDLKTAKEELLKLYQKEKPSTINETSDLIKLTLESITALSKRYKLPFDKSNFRQMTDKKKQEIIRIYEQTCRELYKGVKKNVQ